MKSISLREAEPYEDQRRDWLTRGVQTPLYLPNWLYPLRFLLLQPPSTSPSMRAKVMCNVCKKAVEVPFQGNLSKNLLHLINNDSKDSAHCTQPKLHFRFIRNSPKRNCKNSPWLDTLQLGFPSAAVLNLLSLSNLSKNPDLTMIKRKPNFSKKWQLM